MSLGLGIGDLVIHAVAWTLSDLAGGTSPGLDEVAAALSFRQWAGIDNTELRRPLGLNRTAVSVATNGDDGYQFAYDNWWPESTSTICTAVKKKANAGANSASVRPRSPRCWI
jgi:hypothetical protein